MKKANKRKPKSEECKSDAAEVSDDIQWPSQRELFDAALKLAGDKVFFRHEANLYVKRALWLWLESTKAVCNDSPETYIKPQPYDYFNEAENNSTASQMFFEDLKEHSES
ncbi:hypothetical protein OAM00_06215, partial [Verrucomicrobia bacterium]|nr:hypothetical protein [Verrucomicrobiota bacterium]